MGMTIRVLEAGDGAAFGRLRLEALEAVPEAFGESAAEFRRWTAEEVAARLGPSVEHFVLGAFDGGELRGMAGFRRNAGERRRHKGTVWTVYVTAEYRGRGVGRLLLEALLDRVRTMEGLDTVTLRVGTEQEAARRLYTALGFVVCGVERDALQVGKRRYDEEYREKFLPV